MTDKPQIDFAGAVFEFTQDGNMVGTTEDPEVLTVSFVTQLPGDPPFLVLKSETGWSINDVHELRLLLNTCVDALRRLGVKT